MVRARESSLIALAALVGAIAGLVVAAMSTGVDVLHQLLFRLDPGERLSGLLRLDPVVALTVPLAGGAVFGIATELIARWRPEREVDPIEANALHGGRMSLLGSIIVAAQTVWSSGVGASVGLEAGYTQLGGGIASRLGMAFRLRRADLRILVGCGAAGGIAGAFGAPLAGAFYGFELIIGGYSPNSLAPVAAAALIGFLVAHALAPADIGVVAPERMAVGVHDLVIAATIGLLAAALGILLMRGVALCETLFVRLRVRPALRTTIGGLVVGLLAMVTPQVLSSGHGALRLSGVFTLSLWTVASILVLKIAASIVSLGSGFRGGLFFSSLLMGALGGDLLAIALTMAWPSGHFDPNAYALIGMSALSASVVGGPLTMTFIALETTGDLWLTTAVLIAVIISAQMTREVFGYSFATWRFHLRGLKIHSPEDIGWISEILVGPMMRRDPAVIAASLPSEELRRRFPAGSTKQVFVVDDSGKLSGIIDPAEASAPDRAGADKIVGQLVSGPTPYLLAGDNLRTALTRFSEAAQESLPVIDAVDTRRVIGYLTEAYALRRYASELERRRGDRQDDAGIFSPTAAEAPSPGADEAEGLR